MLFYMFERKEVFDSSQITDRFKEPLFVPYIYQSDPLITIRTMADFLYPIPRQEALRHALDGDGQTNQRRSIAKGVKRQGSLLARARDQEEANRPS